MNIPGDSHLKGSFWRIGNYLSTKFEISGLIKPGAGFKKIMGNTVMVSFRITKYDVLVLSGGVHDVCNNNSKKVILQIVKFLQDSDNAQK